MSSESVSVVVPPRVSIDPSSASTTAVNSSLKRKDAPSTTTLSSSKAQRHETSHGRQPEASYVSTGTSVTPSQAAVRSAAHPSSRAEGSLATTASRATRAASVLPPETAAPPPCRPLMYYCEASWGRKSVPATASDPHPVQRPLQQRQPDLDPHHAKRVEEIELHVQGILEDRLLGNVVAAADKVAALRTLSGYFAETTGGRSAAVDHPLQEFRRAFTDLKGCHQVMNALRQEFDRDHPNDGVVLGVLDFLRSWYSSPQHREPSSIHLYDIESIARTMHVFRFDAKVQHTALATFHNMTFDIDSELRRKVIEANCVPYFVRAMETFPGDRCIHLYAIRVLERLCQTRNRRLVKRMVDDGLVVALAKVYTMYRDSFGKTARAVMVQLLGIE